MKVLSGDQRSLTCVKEDFPTVSGNSEEGRASYMHNCFKATYSLRQFPPWFWRVWICWVLIWYWILRIISLPLGRFQRLIYTISIPAIALTSIPVDEAFNIMSTRTPIGVTFIVRGLVVRRWSGKEWSRHEMRLLTGMEVEATPCEWEPCAAPTNSSCPRVEVVEPLGPSDIFCVSVC